jgi:hypothetical protein
MLLIRMVNTTPSGDGIAAINSVRLGHYEIGIALACWGVSNWLLGSLSNKEAYEAAAEAAAANQAQQAR